MRVRCAGALGGENCPLNGKFRQATVHTSAETVGALYEELKRKRGYALDFSSINATLAGVRIDPGEAESTQKALLSDGQQVTFVGPNRGG